MKNFYAFLLFFVLINVPIFSYAEGIQLKPQTKVGLNQPEQTQVQMLPYIEFIQQWTSYKYQGEELPQVKIEKHTMVQIYAYGDFVYAQAEFKGETLNPVLASYDAQKKVIYISDKIQDDTEIKEIALVHELVHYLQDINGYTASLNGHLECTESEAYDVQILWQIMNHIQEQEIPFTQERSLLSAMECMGDMSKAFSQRK